jgi:hypothetical protein
MEIVNESQVPAVIGIDFLKSINGKGRMNTLSVAIRTHSSKRRLNSVSTGILNGEFGKDDSRRFLSTPILFNVIQSYT